MEQGEHRMIPIWFIIGLNILFYGLVILVTGLVRWNHPAPAVAMTRVHPDVWWGGIMVVVGLFYSVKFRPRR